MAGFLGNQPTNVPLSSADIVDGTVTADDLNSTLNLSSKTVTLPASSVTSHVTSFDDSDIRSDILKLALHQAIDGNRVAYNLEDSFVDGFEDDSGITTETTVDRDTTGEYVNCYLETSGSQTQIAQGTGTAIGDMDASPGSLGAVFDGVTSTTAGNAGYKTSTTEAWVGKDWGAGVVKRVDGFKHFSSSNDGTSASGLNTYGCSITLYGNSTNDTASAVNLGGLTNQNFRLNSTEYSKLTGLTTTSPYRYHWLKFNAPNQAASMFTSEVQFYTSTTIAINATGTLISDPQTASTSRTSCSGVIIYEDAVGTNTLGTDLKIYFTANNGTNWTEAASYGTATTYSGTKKLVKLGATTVTAGSAIAMKAVWANQSSGTQSQIAQGTGTAIGNAVSNGGLSSAFDANTNQAGSSSATISAGSGNDTIYVGKDWGSGVTKTISGFKVYSTNNDGISSSGASGSSGCSLTLFGSNSNDISSATNLGGLTSLSFRTNSTTYTKISGLTTTTAYRYHWVKGVSNGHSGSLYFAEVEFYETSTAKEARLHGWAVNY